MRARAAAEGVVLVRPGRRAELDGKLGYASPLDISMESSKLEDALGWKFRSMREVLAADPQQQQAAKATSGGGQQTTTAPPVDVSVHLFRFVDALFLALFAVLVAVAVRRTPSVEG